jgi:hypothetical protein
VVGRAEENDQYHVNGPGAVTSGAGSVRLAPQAGSPAMPESTKP